jgi:rSAM/selenodomain-associated transferase 1
MLNRATGCMSARRKIRRSEGGGKCDECIHGRVSIAWYDTGFDARARCARPACRADQLVASKRRHLAIFARSPRLGRVKSRLAEQVGPFEALRLHRLIPMDVNEKVARSPRWRCWIWVTPEPAVWPRGIPRRLQAKGDLAERMADAVRSLPAGPVVLVGTDIPDLDVDNVTRAFAALQCNDAVFGPAEDNGYWLVVLRRRPQFPHLFDGIRWSSEHALADTVANLWPGRRYALVDTLADVNDVAGLTNWKRRCAGLPTRAPN